MPGEPANPNADVEQYEKWARLAVDCAQKLTPFQSPSFRAIMVAASPPSRDEDGESGNIIPLDDPIAASRIYRRIMSAGSRR
jgi:hypothetical protein